MSFLQRFKQYLYNRQLQKVLQRKKTSRKSQNWSDCKHIAFLFDANDNSTVEDILTYIRKLEKKGKKVSLFGYLNLKEDPQNSRFDFFHNKDISFNYIPKGAKIDNFIKEQFDLLINFFPNHNPSLEYISTCSKARCRIGHRSENIHCFDLVINIEQNDFAFYVKQIEQILSKMNQKLNEPTV